MHCNPRRKLVIALALGSMLGASGVATAALHEVEQVGLTFVPDEITVAPGDTVRWNWNSGDHTVTSGSSCSYDGLYFDELLTAAHPTVEFVVPDGVSEIPYFCRPHCGVGMIGTINVAAPPIEFMITLDGWQEETPVEMTGSGTGTASLDPNTNTLSWDITFSGLSGAATAAHFHGPAPQCEGAGIEIPIGSTSPIVGSAVLTTGQVDDLMAGLWYVNIHTGAHPSGEIRGQVMPVPLDDPIPDPIAAGDYHIVLETVATGLTAPNWGATAPGDSSRLFVTDQDGTLWAIDVATGTASVFLDVSSRLVSLGIGGPGSFDERGFLGVAFHPNYEENGLLYTYTSEPVSGEADFSTIPMGESANHQAVILEWMVPDPTNPESVVDPGSARELLRIDEPQFNHDGGAVVFGPDGMLYISLGDGGGGDDKDGQLTLGAPMIGHGCEGNGQNINSVLGAVLRIDPDGSDSANGQYGIPGDNPFVGVDGIDEIFIYGLRNPFRFSFDSMTGDLWVADVGQNDIEEINIAVSGGNYGWNHKEGSFFFVANGTESGYVTDRPLSVPGGLLDPIAEYDHDEGTAIVGGFVYRGAKIPVLQGRYVCGDFARTFSNDGRLFYLDADNTIVEFNLVGQDGLNLSLLGFGQDASGELYVLANGTGTPFESTGVVLRIATLPGDGGADGDVDLEDYVSFEGCLAGPGAAAPPGCAHMDLNMDGGVDLADWQIFQQAFTGAP